MNPANFVTIGGASDLAGVSERAIRAAIERGELTPQLTHCGRAKLLPLTTVKAWAKADRPRGRKPQNR